MKKNKLPKQKAKSVKAKMTGLPAMPVDKQPPKRQYIPIKEGPFVPDHTPTPQTDIYE